MQDAQKKHKSFSKKTLLKNSAHLMFKIRKKCVIKAQSSKSSAFIITS